LFFSFSKSKQLIAVGIYLLAPLWLNGFRNIVEDIFKTLTFCQLSRIYPIVCGELRRLGSEPPMLSCKIIARCLLQDYRLSKLHSLSLDESQNKIARRVAKLAYATPKILCQIHSDILRKLYFKYSNLNPTQADQRYDSIFSIRHFRNSDLRDSHLFNYYEKTLVVAAKPNPTRQVIALVFADCWYKKTLGIYAYGDGPEKRLRGQCLYYYSGGPLAKPLNYKFSSTLNVLNVSWSPDGDKLIALHCNPRTKLSSEILIFAFESDHSFRRIDLGEKSLIFGNVRWLPWAESCMHNLWLSKDTFIFPNFNLDSSIAKLEIKLGRRNKVSVETYPNYNPPRLYSWSKPEFSDCEFEKSIKLEDQSCCYQPSVYCLADYYFVAVEHCPVVNHQKHSSLSYTYLLDNCKGTLIFHNAKIHDLAPLTGAPKSLLLLLTVNHPDCKIKVTNLSGEDVRANVGQCPWGEVLIATRAARLRTERSCAKTLILASISFDEDEENDAIRVKELSRSWLLLSERLRLGKSGHQQTLTIAGQNETHVIVKPCCVDLSQSYNNDLDDLLFVSKIFDNFCINLWTHYRTRQFIYHPNFNHSFEIPTLLRRHLQFTHDTRDFEHIKVWHTFNDQNLTCPFDSNDDYDDDDNVRSFVDKGNY